MTSVKYIIFWIFSATLNFPQIEIFCYVCHFFTTSTPTSLEETFSIRIRSLIVLYSEVYILLGKGWGGVNFESKHNFKIYFKSSQGY